MQSSRGETQQLWGRNTSRKSGLLIAVVVALLVVAIGLLSGLLSKQTSFCKEMQDAHHRGKNQSSEAGTMDGGQGPVPPWAASYRLPAEVVPASYDLTLRPELMSGSFSGRVDIAVDVASPTDHFIVHAKMLTVNRAEVLDGHGIPVAVEEHFEYPENEFWVVTLTRRAAPGRYTLRYHFNGSLTNGMVGFYRSHYNAKDGRKRFLATSKFEPTYARRAYPCFDEPNFRAIFNVNLVHPGDYFALSNMPAIGVATNDDGTKTTTFAPSVAMPTYLTCFIVCDFKFTNATTDDGKLFRVFARPDQVEFTRNALNVGKQIQDYYSTYYNIPYPLPKQDMIAIPDFVSGAMEHWGLVTFRETNLLFDPNESSLANERRVASVVGHELAHMWFGNLVTMMWWDDLWLNEGFASYLEYLGVAHVRKDWKEDEMIIVNDLQPVMLLDAGLNSHPIIQPVGHPDEITEIFDSISYSKGASVLRMLDNFMGADDFRAGLHNYLKKYSFGNARTDDLWRQLSNASTQKLDVSTIMDTWTKQMGFPVVSVKRNPRNKGEFTVSQERFFLSPEDADKMNKSESPFGYKWEVPLTYRQTDGSVQTQWLHKEVEKKFEIPWASSGQFVKFNVDQTGFYKVNYEEDVWREISQSLAADHRQFSRSDRANLVNDAFTLSKGGYLNYSLALDLSTYLKMEEDFLPWEAVEGEITSISLLLMETDMHQKFKDYVLRICTPLYTKLGWKNEGDDLTRMLRPLVLKLLCEHGHADCLKEANQQLKAWMAGTPISPNLRSLVYCYGMEGSAGTADWDFMWEKYVNSSSAQEKMKLLSGLACIKEPQLLYRYLEYLKDPSKIRGQDFFTVLVHISYNAAGRSIVWDFVREEWTYLVTRFTLNDRSLGKLIPQITSSFAKEVRKQEMLDFFAKYPDAGAGARARVQALDKVQLNINWLKRYRTDIKNWLDGNAS